MVPVILHQALWVVPVDGPVIPHGAVAVSRGRILAVGPALELRRRYAGKILDHGEGALLPGLVNAHIHLEFSPLRGQIPPQPDFPSWLTRTLAAAAALTPEAVAAAARQAVAEARRTGTVLLAEVSNTGTSWSWLRNSSMEFHYFYECLGFNMVHGGPLEEDFPFLTTGGVPGAPNFSLAAHAPYSVSPELFRRLSAWNRRRGRRQSVHLAESPEETRFLATGNGFFRELLQRRGRWHEAFVPPGCSPVSYMEHLGFLGPETLAVHGLQLTGADKTLLARRGTTVVLCPRSNLHTGAGFPDLPGLLAAGIPVALGTDSLASNRDVNLWQEMVVLHDHYPDVPISRLLDLATLGGAEALGRAGDFGTLTPGKRAALLFVPLEEQGDFWEELLRAGAAGKVSWAQKQENRHG
jgi:cytosine/adenosine deaminase-related metal-dependent hydrolase